jgi:hypothetical protein
MSRAGEEVRRGILLSLWAALVPARERQELERRGARPLGWSVVLGFVELALGAELLFGSGLGHFQRLGEMAAAEIVAMDPRTLAAHPAAVGWVGAVIWLSWLLRPLTWLLLSTTVVGALRLVAFGVSRDVVGEPLVWLALRIGQGLSRVFAVGGRRSRFGPQRADRLRREPGGGLVVMSARPKPQWSPAVTVEIDGRFYRLARVEERRDGPWWGFAHHLEEREPNELIRALVRYEPPPPA